MTVVLTIDYILLILLQACIDDNLDMVEFLVEHGADINRGDHEGWTPLHATASCGFLSIARYVNNDKLFFPQDLKNCHLEFQLRYLIEHNSDVAAVNNDGELPIDIAETEAMEELLERETQLRGMSKENKTKTMLEITCMALLWIYDQQALTAMRREAKRNDKCLPTLVGGWKATRPQLGCSSRTLEQAQLRCMLLRLKATSEL